MDIHLSTSHEILPDASVFSDILDPGLSAVTTWNDDVLNFQAIALPPLKVPSGKITASDAFILDASSFTCEVPPRNHPVTLAIALINTDERVAFAQVRFSSKPAMRWSLAVKPGQDPSRLKPDQFWGYGVDSGTGCFADSEAYQIISEAMSESLNDRMVAEAQKVYRNTRDWLSIDAGGGSMASFSSGFGDGLYGSYFGFGENDELVSLVTDFGIVKWQATRARRL